MENQEERSAKKGEELSWKCPICGQDFKDFLPVIKHIEEHSRYELAKIELGGKDYLQKLVAREFSPGAEIDRKGEVFRPTASTKRKLAEQAKGLLPVVAEWLEKALITSPEINDIVSSDLRVADQLVDFAKRLPDTFREQRDYLLKHERRMRDTGTDPKWPRKPGGQVRFVAESMAGAEWDLTPSSSREFVRLKKPRRGSTPAVTQRWWDRRSTAADSGEKEEEE